MAPVLASGHLVVFLAASTLAGPLADIDHPGSMYGRWLPLPGVAKVGGQIESYRRGPFGNAEHSHGHVGRVLPGGIFWHRGATHSFVMSLIFSVLFLLLARHFVPMEAWSIGFGVLTGYLSHLALDALNVSGQQLLWPFSHKPVRPPWPHIPVGSLGEVLTVVALVGGLLLWAPHILSALRLPHGI